VTMRWPMISSGTVLALAVAAGRASACPSCYGSVDEKVLQTYFGTAMMLTLLPFSVLAAIAGAGWLLARPAPAP